MWSKSDDISRGGFWQAVRQYERTTRRLIVKPGDPKPLPITKVGGVPWWPLGLARPRCQRGHQMSFIAQILLRDVPQRCDSDPDLLSFHYCQECVYEGNMAWGMGDVDNGGYDLSVFSDWDRKETDGLGILTEDVIGPCKVTFSERLETPSYEEIQSVLALADLFRSEYDEEEFACIMSDAYPFNEEDYPDFIHIPTSKLGGWPSWTQNVEWPPFDRHKESFVAQFDWVLGENTSWGGGGYAYLFVTDPSVVPRKAELLIQTT